MGTKDRSSVLQFTSILINIGNSIILDIPLLSLVFLWNFLPAWAIGNSKSLR